MAASRRSDGTRERSGSGAQSVGVVSVQASLLLFLIPAVAVAAFPMFSSFAPAKALVAGVLLAAALVWRRGPSASARGSGVTLSTIAEGPQCPPSAPVPGLLLALLYLFVSLPSMLFSNSTGQALHAAHLDLVGVVVFLLALGVCDETACCNRPSLQVLAAAGENGRERAGQEAGKGPFLERLASWGSIAILLVAVPASVEMLLGQPLLGYALLPGGATLGNPDLSAEFVAMALPAAGLGLASSRRSRRWLSIAAIACALLLLTLIPSVTARLAAGGIALFGGLAWWGTRMRRALPFLVLLLLAAGIAAALLVWGEGRLHLYRTALDCALERPLAGHGAGSFPGCFLEHQAQRVAADTSLLPGWTNARHAHDEWLQLWAERGILAPLVLALLFATAPFGRMLDFHRHGNLRSLWLAAAVLAATLCASGSVSLAHYPGRILAFLWLGLACAKAAGEDNGPARRAGPEGDPSDRPLVAAEGIAPQAAGEEPQKSPRIRLVAWASAWLVALILVAVPSWEAAVDFQFVRGRYDQTLALDPGHAGAAFRLGQRLAESGNTPVGCRLIEQALESSPDVNVAVAAGVCRARNGELQEGIRHLENTVRWHPRFGTAHANLAEVYRLAGKQEEAWRHITRALSLWPGRKDFHRIRKAVCADNPFCLPAKPTPRYDTDRTSATQGTIRPR